MAHVFIIAEAGVNHNGSIKTALKMVEVAAKAGADAIKFQTFIADKLVSKSASKASYQQLTTNAEESQLDMLKKLELNREDHLRLIDHAKKHNIQFLSTPFDPESIDLLADLGIMTFKIPSGEITNLPYLRKIGNLKRNVILSTGMATLDEVGNALRILTSEGSDKKNIVVLHATTEYPAPFEDINLRALASIEKAFGVKVGYSDHTTGIEVSIAAVALGATVIEKHFTLDRNMEGPDHKASLEPMELENLIKSIRHIEKALGDGIKKSSLSEMKNIHLVRKSIHYLKDLSVGHTITEADLTMKRPGNGISPMEMFNVISKKLALNVVADTQVKWEDLI